MVIIGKIVSHSACRHDKVASDSVRGCQLLLRRKAQTEHASLGAVPAGRNGSDTVVEVLVFVLEDR